MSSHTPGPWDDASKYPGVDSVRIFAKTHYIATVGNSDDPRAVTEANARLIAAAPDLLAALRRVVDEHAIRAVGRLQGDRVVIPFEALEDARAAIAKAEGAP